MGVLCAVWKVLRSYIGENRVARSTGVSPSTLPPIRGRCFAYFACLEQGNGLFQEPACLGIGEGPIRQYLRDLGETIFVLARILLAGLAVVSSGIVSHIHPESLSSYLTWRPVVTPQVLSEPVLSARQSKVPAVPA